MVFEDQELLVDLPKFGVELIGNGLVRKIHRTSSILMCGDEQKHAIS